jgi:aconitate hydratase
VVDLAAMRDAVVDLGGSAERINPLSPGARHRSFGAGRRPGTRDALRATIVERNKERHAFLRWGQNAFDNFKVVREHHRHQVNIEYPRVSSSTPSDGFPRLSDTLVGTDSPRHINGLGVRRGVGGIRRKPPTGQPVTCSFRR